MQGVTSNSDISKRVLVLGATNMVYIFINYYLYILALGNR